MPPSPTILLSLVIVLAAAVAPLAGDDWHPAAGPLMTQWAKEVTPEHVLEEYPRPTLVRTAWQNLNGLWDYQITAKGEERRPETYGGRIMVPFPIESALSGVMKACLPDQRLWYRRHFKVPAAWLAERIVLRFGAVDWSCEVIVDGTSLGTHRGGYDAFAFDINRALHGDGEHELVVSVTDPNDSGWQLRGKQSLHPGGAFYTASSGIWQTVWLEPVPHSAIEALHPLADLAKGVLHLEVATRTRPEAMVVRASVSDGGAVVASAELALNAEIRGDVKENLAWYKATAVGNQLVLELPLASAKAWTPESPFLYDLAVELRDKDGALLDRVQSYAAMRTIEVGHAGQNTVPLLNGRPVFFQGALEQGFWPDGLYTPPSDEARRFDIEAAKKLGLNTIRKHIKVEPERFYYKLGATASA